MTFNFKEIVLGQALSFCFLCESRRGGDIPLIHFLSRFVFTFVEVGMELKSLIGMIIWSRGGHRDWKTRTPNRTGWKKLEKNRLTKKINKLASNRFWF